ncbi:MAG: hypothetical protein HC869_05230 [Rhodospirillales bacterium]|nr:hypothetical protein [Rhodospirillales bacterium]
MRERWRGGGGERRDLVATRFEEERESMPPSAPAKISATDEELLELFLRGSKAVALAPGKVTRIALEEMRARQSLAMSPAAALAYARWILRDERAGDDALGVHPAPSERIANLPDRREAGQSTRLGCCRAA